MQRPDGTSYTDSDLPASVKAINAWRRWAIFVLRWGILVAVVIGVSRRIWLEKGELDAYELHLSAQWLAVGGICYITGLIACALFWWLAMQDFGARPTWTSTLAAYYLGHLGKYVPGKGLTLIIRATRVRGIGITVRIATITCFQETLLMMATGALTAFVLLFGIEVPHHRYLVVWAGLLAAALGVLVLPPVGSRLGQLASRAFAGTIPNKAESWRWRTIAIGGATILPGWMLLGLSLGAVLAATHQLAPLVIYSGMAKGLALLTVVVALATVGGFASMMPGGLGTREWILMETLGPILGNRQAVVAAVMLRLVWIISEVLAATTFWIVDLLWNRSKLHPH